MINLSKHIQSLTTFRRNSGEFMKHLKKTKRPMVLTVNGKAAAVVQDPEAYQRLLDIAAQGNAEEGIRQGLEDIKAGRVSPRERSSKISKSGMAYAVNFSRRAERDLELLLVAIDAESSDAALHCYLGLQEAILTGDA